ncbi:pentapeptide repeat-containing protein [Aphanothece sacrum]|uniref:pentapeptide repeat-containing protein n=1 Tax=Aphanothece sacrum TaxID=1122 RepID=UPI000F60C574|nr:pentapeptide repeat-containing protein [Aphanothece sacrum]GBF86260.1 pentapeptide repeat protein [Aphanothece sacrum FPU3]
MSSKTVPSNFITTQPLHRSGKAAEQIVWEAIQGAFYHRKCLGYWRYPIFSLRGKSRQEPDILIADAELGLIIIEVKAITADQIISIEGHRWNYQNFYVVYGNPYQQAENQLFSLLEYIQQEPILNNQVTSRVLVALPLITEQQWEEKGFKKLPNNPPILFKNHLVSSEFIQKTIMDTPSVVPGKVLSDQQWNLLLSILSGTAVFSSSHHKVLSHPESKGKVLEKVRLHLSKFDLQQEKIAKQIPPGCQRIRGIAGSGKTVLLCQKAAIMHLKYPNWKLVFIFFSRSLYDEIIQQIDQWMRYFSHEQQHYQKNNPYLQVFHAWGSHQQMGFYRYLCQVTGVMPLSVNETGIQKPNEALAEVCVDLLQKTGIPQIFDAILIDEGQDLISDTWSYQGKQPFYWLAYQALRPSDPMSPEQKRLIWAYDELQSLDTNKIANATELLGEELGNLVTGSYGNEINKTEIMSTCYRTPHPIIIAAHGLGMGWLRPGGMLTGMTHKKEWETLGYQIEGNLVSGEKITIKRHHNNSVNPLPSMWKDSLLKFNIYSSRHQEIIALSQQIKHNLRYDGLRPSREILVIILGSSYEAKQRQKQIANFLNRQGIDIFIPGTEKCNQWPDDSNSNPNKFWCEGAVTISQIYRAKGHEADMVYIVGLDELGKAENNLSLRHQLLIALTRSKGWVNLSGIGHYPFYQEVKKVIENKENFTLTFMKPKQRELRVTDTGELLYRYGLGERNFKQANLQNATLQKLNLSDINLIGANLVQANLQQTELNRAKLVGADLSSADLTQASLIKAKLIGANLQDANLTGANLNGADLRDANLTGVIWEGKS